jgi:hypothetical protein
MTTVQRLEEPQDLQQQLALAIWQQLSDDWQPEREFLERLRGLAGIEDYADHDLSALFLSLHSADYIEVRRGVGRGNREVRRSPERPRFSTWVEQAERGSEEQSSWEKRQRERELQRKEDARLELTRYQRAAETEEVREAVRPELDELRERLSEAELRVRRLEGRLRAAGIDPAEGTDREPAIDGS